MTDIREKALALVNELFAESGGSPIDYAVLFGAGDIVTLALCRAIEQREAYKQEVSDAVETHFKSYFTPYDLPDIFKQFIIKPDPLVEVMKKAGWADAVIDSCAPSLSAALDALGFEIREKGQ